MKETVRSLNKLLDLDLAIIEDAYQAEYVARLQRSERLATLGQVAGGVAHELRNPLNVVKTSVYYLLNARNPTPEKQADHLRRIERNVELADNVITALSNFARIPVPDMRPIAIEPMVREALEINPPGEADRGRQSTARRAARALGDGDQLRIAFGQPDPQRARRHAAGRPADDHGADRPTDASRFRWPIPASASQAKDLARIMEPLYSTKARGLGLGLAIARSIVEKNQGTLQVASEPGRGSIFTIRLAAAPSDGAPS